jgi:hypothetical protein
MTKAEQGQAITALLRAACIQATEIWASHLPRPPKIAANDGRFIEWHFLDTIAQYCATGTLELEVLDADTPAST